MVRRPERLERLLGRQWPLQLGTGALRRPNVPVKPEPSTQVSNIVEHNASISFNVSRAVGVPVVVTVSYFPNWQVSGAQGVYRISPNLMVVVPTSHHVSLSYGYTPVDYEGWGLSLLALVGLFFLIRRPVAPVVAVRRLALGRRAPPGAFTASEAGSVTTLWEQGPGPALRHPGRPRGPGRRTAPSPPLPGLRRRTMERRPTTSPATVGRTVVRVATGVTGLTPRACQPGRTGA